MGILSSTAARDRHIVLDSISHFAAHQELAKVLSGEKGKRLGGRKEVKRATGRVSIVVRLAAVLATSPMLTSSSRSRLPSLGAAMPAMWIVFSAPGVATPLGRTTSVSPLGQERTTPP